MQNKRLNLLVGSEMCCNFASSKGSAGLRRRKGTTVAVHGNNFSKALRQERPLADEDGTREMYNSINY